MRRPGLYSIPSSVGLNEELRKRKRTAERDSCLAPAWTDFVANLPRSLFTTRGKWFILPSNHDTNVQRRSPRAIVVGGTRSTPTKSLSMTRLFAGIWNRLLPTQTERRRSRSGRRARLCVLERQRLPRRRAHRTFRGGCNAYRQNDDRSNRGRDHCDRRDRRLQLHGAFARHL
jgi:hypothetical protein